MTLARVTTLLRSIKFVPFAFFFVFLFSNLTGVLSHPVLAPTGNNLLAVEILPLDIPTSGDPKLDRIILDAAKREALDPRFVHAVIWQESKYEGSARSQAGAQGLMQLMPGTARRFGCEDVNDPAANVAAGTKYLSWLLKRFAGNIELALAGYNAGEGSVDKYNGVPPYTETQNYVRIITSRYGKTYHPLLSSEEANVAFNLSAGPSNLVAAHTN
jgi:hypothetical protein